MKMLKIGIASYEDMKARTLAIARGELKPKATDPKVWFPSTESLIRVLSDKNRLLLGTIRDPAAVSFRSGANDGQEDIEPVAHAENDGALRNRKT